MKQNSDFIKSNWKDPFWEIVRYYCSLRGKEQKQFIVELGDSSSEISKARKLLGLKNDVADSVFKYLNAREPALRAGLSRLRTEEESISFCKKENIEWKLTRTQSKDHHQSSKTLIATVTAIAERVCKKKKITLESNPQKRCVWLHDNHLHVRPETLMALSQA